MQCIAHTSDGCMYLAIEAGAMIRSTDSGRTFIDRSLDSPVDTRNAMEGAAGGMHKRSAED